MHLGISYFCTSRQSWAKGTFNVRSFSIAASFNSFEYLIRHSSYILLQSHHFFKQLIVGAIMTGFDPELSIARSNRPHKTATTIAQNLKLGLKRILFVDWPPTVPVSHIGTQHLL